MMGALKRSHAVSQVLRTQHSKKITDLFPDPVAGGSRIHRNHHHLMRNQTQSRDYSKFIPHLWRKATRAYNEASPYSLFSSSSFASSSSRTASFSEVGFVGWYLGLVKSRPVLTKGVTASLIYIAADLSSQTITSSGSFDLVRTLRMAGYGLLILGPSLHFWFNFVSKVFPKRDVSNTLKKMALGQTVYGPVMTTVFLSLNARFQGETTEEIVARLKRDLFPTLISGVCYWPICDFITFRFIPVHLQPLVSNSFSYLWTVYLTYMASLEKAGTTSS